MNCFCPLFSCDPKFFPVWFLLLPLQPRCNSLTLSSFLPTTCWNPVSKKPNYLVSGLTPGQLSTERKSHSCFPPQLSLQRHFIPAISSLSLWHHGSLLIHTFLFSSTLGSQRKSTGVFLTSCHQIYDLVLIYTHHFSPSHLQQRKQSPCNILFPLTLDSVPFLSLEISCLFIVSPIPSVSPCPLKALSYQDFKSLPFSINKQAFL